MTGIRLISLTALFAVTGVLEGCAMTLTNIPSAAEKVEMVPVSTATQQMVAAHEGAHMLVQAMLFGSDTVGEIHVHTEVCKDYDPDVCCAITGKRHIGAAPRKPEGFWEMLFPKHDLTFFRDRIVLYLVGPATERALTPAGSFTHDGIDEKYAEDVVVAIGEMLRRSAQDSRRGRPFARELHGWSSARELERGRLRAEAFVRANKKLIIALGERIMKSPVRDGAHRLSPEAFTAFMRGKHIVDPAKTHSKRK